MNRIVFLAVNSSHSHTNLAAWYLRAFTRDLGWEWEDVELVAGEEIYSTLARVAALQPQFLAASLYAFNRSTVLSLIRRYKSMFPDCKIIVGGPELLGDNTAFLGAERSIDAAVRGEGELAFRQILERFDAPETWPAVKGFCGFSADRYCDNGMADEIELLDDIPSPYIAALSRPLEKPFVQIETSRGCRNSCLFCVSGGGAVRYFSQPRVRSDMAAVRSAGIRHVRLVDRTFNDNAARCVSLLRMFREEFKEMNIHLEIDPARLPESVATEFALARKGQYHLDVGVQSLNPAVLGNVRRQGGAARAVSGLTQLCGLGNLAVHADLIAGLPGACLDDVFGDLGRLVRLGPQEIQLELLKLLPGTPLSKDRVKWNIAASPEPPYEVLRTAEMSVADVYAAHRLSKLVDWFHGPDCLRDTVRLANSELPSFWKDLCEFCAARWRSLGQPSLVNRFRLLNDFLAGAPEKLGQSLQYAWMKHGLSPDGRSGICRASQWKAPIPADAILVEGDAAAALMRKWVITLDRTYIFGYGDRGVTNGAEAIYAVPSGKDAVTSCRLC